MSLKATLPTGLLLNHHRRAQAFAGYYAARRANIAKQAPAPFDFPTQAVGATPDGKVTVLYDPALGQQGAALAQQLLQTASATYSQCQQTFNVQGGPVNVIIAALNGAIDGSSGAYHHGCDFNTGGDLYCDAAFANPLLTNALMVAELTECFMGLQDKGWGCSSSNGEALSRFLAEQSSNGPDGVLSGYETAGQWDQAGRPDWINAAEPTDQDPVSTGCGVAYLYWMLSRGYSAAQITQTGCPDGTLSSNYASLTGTATAWQDFTSALAALQGPIASDNPWPNQPAKQPPPAVQPGGQIVIDTTARTVALPDGWTASTADKSAKANLDRHRD